jgi:hypothetical protein
MEGRALPGAALALLVAVSGCMGGAEPIPVGCGSVPPTDPDILADTLAVTIVLAQPPSRATDVLVRVDPLSERGAVLFSDTAPESAAAVSASVTTDAVFHGCVNERADGFRLQVEEAPIGRVYVRISSNRPVAVRLAIEAADGAAPGSLPDRSEVMGGGQQAAELIVSPGASGRRAWSFDPPFRSRE